MFYRILTFFSNFIYIYIYFEQLEKGITQILPTSLDLAAVHEGYYLFSI